MKITRKNITVLLLLTNAILNYDNVNGQLNYNVYKKFNYQWEDAKPNVIQVDKLFSGEDVVYLEDKNIISIAGSLGVTNEVLLQRKARIKFLTQKGIDKHALITIPESYDPLYDYHNIPFKNNKIKKAQPYFDIVLKWFAVRIIKADGTVVNAEFSEEFNQEDVLSMIVKQTMTLKYYKSHYWNFLIKNLKPGDEMEYDYQVAVPYNFPDNFFFFNSNRIFFNGEEPRQNFSLVLKYKTGPAHVLKYMNQAEPDSVAIIDKIKYHYWTKTNLAGSMDEQGAQPYQTLPYIIYSLNTESDFLKYNDEISTKIIYMPFWIPILSLRESYEYSIRKSAQVNLKDKQNLLVDAFIKRLTEGIADSMSYEKFSRIHTFIVDSFKYVNDEAFYREIDTRAERIGEYTADGKIRDVSRQKIYSKLLNELKLDYFTIYLMDKRYGKINSDYLSPIWNNEYLFAVRSNNKIALVHPKKSDTGLYLEELPFYWENTSGMNVNYDDIFYILAKKARILGTASSSLNDNIRLCNIMVNVDTEKMNAIFDAKVSLSGQYSTITRPMYLSTISDSVNNELYNKKISDINVEHKILTTEITSRKSVFPFKFDLRTKYESGAVITKNKDGNMSLNLGGWFNHIIYDSLKTDNRTLDFYPDFTGQDTYRYYIKFNRSVEVVSGLQNIDLNNALGKLIINFSQPQPDVLMIESFFVTSAEKIIPEKIKDVSDIFGAISKLNNSTIVLK